ncbi:MAG: hypothetical protein A2Z20_04175 [Bdellovibrionales bacterium RBG_16_40_8]|nr:MAG: hypothetical protein A2Z20_04175 [Bdellovibrionales bacterium RBG_16_40_8]
MKSTYNNFEWERSVILELNREHESLCNIHRVNLRPIAITLFDSDSLWGQFDNRTRTISISRKLVNEHPWQHVVGVFHHEMAHQYVAEQMPKQYQNVRPHGELFKEACRRLGIRDQFTKAGIDLQNCNLDWRTNSINETTEKILDKAKKLLALANSTNEHEAHLAMERVRELYAKFNLQHISVAAKDHFIHLIITLHKKRMSSCEQRLISILAEHFFVKVLLFQQFDAKSGERFRAIELIGIRENVLMAEYVYYFLLQQVEFLLQHAIASKLGLTRSDRISFKLGVLDGFDKKLQQSNRVSSNKAPAAASAKTTELTVIGVALAKFKNDSHLEDYISKIYPRLRNGRSSSISIDDIAFAAGHSAGKSINLNRPITASMGNKGNFLNSRSS